MASFSSLWNNQRLLIASIFLICLLITLMFLLFFKNVGPQEHEVPGSDYEVIYKPMTRNLLAGQGIPLQRNAPVSAPPGYAFFLVPLFALADYLQLDPVSLIIFANAIIVSIATCVLFIILEQFFDKSTAFIATLLWISYPLHLWFIKNPNTEVPFLLVFFLALWCYGKSISQKNIWVIAISGFLLGIAILIRPFILFLPLFLSIILIQWRHSIPTAKFALALLGASIITISPWVIYASQATSRFVLISSAGIRTTVTGWSYAFVGDGKYQYTIPEDVRSLMQRIRKSTITSGSEFIVFTLHELVTHPLALLKLLLFKLARSWYATYGMWWEKQLFLLQIPYLFSAVAGIYLTFTQRQRTIHKHWATLLLTIILYFWSMTFATLSIVRYMIPAMSLVMVFSAVALHNLVKTYYE